MGQALCRTLVGRGAELRLLEDALASARSGHGRTVVVAGEAGMGKSRLARELTEQARQAGWVVMVGRAVAASVPVPYRPIAEGLQSALRRVPLPEPAGLVPYRPALGRLIPEWRQSGAAVWTDDASWLLAEGTLRLVRALAGKDGALVVLEDLHWADPDTLALVEYLADNVDDERVLLLATRRSGEAGRGTDVLRDLVGRRAATEVVLQPLDAMAVAEMVAECVGPAGADRAVAHLAARAEGIPLLVEELLATADPAGLAEGRTEATAYTAVPHSFADTIRRRLSCLGEDAQVVLQAAAVLGRSFDWHLLPAMTALAPDAVLDVLGRAERAQLLRSTGRGGDAAFAFRHALTGDAVLGELLPHEQARLAAGALAALEAAWE